LDRSASPLPRWFPDAVLNTCDNAVDRHVRAGHGARLALLYDSPVTQTQRQITYTELQTMVGPLCTPSPNPGRADRRP
jgi:propionyl-CoA synthetase